MDRRRLIYAVIGGAVFVAIAAVAFFVVAGPGRDPAKAARYAAQGDTALQAGNIKGARDAYKKAVKADSHSVNGHYGLGYVYQVYDHKTADAEAEYREAIDLQPRSIKSLYSLAVLRARAQDREEAIGLYQRVIQLDESFAEAHFNLGLLLIDSGESAAGHAEIDRGVALKPALGARIATTTTIKPKK